MTSCTNSSTRTRSSIGGKIKSERVEDSSFKFSVSSKQFPCSTSTHYPPITIFCPFTTHSPYPTLISNQKFSPLSKLSQSRRIDLRTFQSFSSTIARAKVKTYFKCGFLDVIRTLEEDYPITICPICRSIGSSATLNRISPSISTTSTISLLTLQHLGEVTNLTSKLTFLPQIRAS